MPGSSPILYTETLLRPSGWRTFDPFLYVSHLSVVYPKSSAKGPNYEDLGPDPKLLLGRDLGNDFVEKDGFKMMHGEVVPGFPSHPHYGFETVTIVRKGIVDHFDSHGNTARYGAGDVQWLTTGSGIQHSEMLPLLNADGPNPAESFQIWLNLAQAKKQSKPFFSMAWGNQQPRRSFGQPGKQMHLRIIGGQFLGLRGVSSPPDSYASDPKSEVIIAILTLDPGASFTLPPASSSADIHRTLYWFSGSSVQVDSQTFTKRVALIKVAADAEVELKGLGPDQSEFLLLQGRPLQEPVVQSGPFVTGSREELIRVHEQYRKTHFGGWRWGQYDPVHPRHEKRFFSIDGKRVDAPLDDDDIEEKQAESSMVVGENCKVVKTGKFSTIESKQ